MAALNMYNPMDEYMRTALPAQELPRVVRYSTGHNAEGKSVFLSTGNSERYNGSMENALIANNAFSMNQPAVGVRTHVKEPNTTVENGSVCRMIDFVPGGVLPMHRVNSLDYAIVIEGVFKMILDSGEERILQRGDIAVQRSTAHSWVNITGKGLLPARILFVLLDINDLHVGSEKVQRELGVLRKDSATFSNHDLESMSVRDGGYFRENDFFEPEF